MTTRRLQAVIESVAASDGAGVKLRRSLGSGPNLRFDPFLMLDEFFSDDPNDYIAGFPSHPHRGFETVTYMLDGVFEHADSNGGGGVITNGDTQWMTAGAGILHIEKPPEWLVAQGGLFHGFQLWVNLPRAQKLAAPRYQDIRASEVALLASQDGGTLVRVIAGEVAGHAGPGSTYTPMTLVHLTLAPGATVQIPWRADYNALAYVLAGRGTVGTEARPAQLGQLAVFGPGNTLTFAADQVQESRAPNLDVLVLGGRPIREPVAWAGPFVMNTREEVMQAFEDYQAGRLGQIPAVHGAPTTLQESANASGPGEDATPA